MNKKTVYIQDKKTKQMRGSIGRGKTDVPVTVFAGIPPFVAPVVTVATPQPSPRVAPETVLANAAAFARELSGAETGPPEQFEAVEHIEALLAAHAELAAVLEEVRGERDTEAGAYEISDKLFNQVVEQRETLRVERDALLKVIAEASAETERLFGPSDEHFPTNDPGTRSRTLGRGLHAILHR